MNVISRDPTTQIAFSMFENKGVYAVLLGSGVSRSAGIPTGWEITMELVKRAGIAEGVGAQEDWLKWYVEHTGKQPNYSSLLEELARSAGQVVSKQDLSLNALGCPLTRYDRRIDVHISSIRQKLGPRPDAKAWIQSVRGLGYLLIAE